MGLSAANEPPETKLLLELAKEALIEVTQAEAFAPIYVRLAYQSA